MFWGMHYSFNKAVSFLDIFYNASFIKNKAMNFFCGIFYYNKADYSLYSLFSLFMGGYFIFKLKLNMLLTPPED